MGLEVDAPTGGCCGQAGAWGFEAGHVEISRQIGEHALLPAVRAAAPDTIVVANGFSCRTQIEQAGTGRRARHVAEVLRLAREARAVAHDHAAPVERARRLTTAARRRVRTRSLASGASMPSRSSNPCLPTTRPGDLQRSLRQLARTS